MIRLRDWKIAERLVYWVVGILVILLPLAFWDFSDVSQRYRIIGGWIRIIPFLIIFIIHDRILLPRLYFANRRLLYFISVIVLILFVNYLFVYSSFIHNQFDKIFAYSQHLGQGAGAVPEMGPGRAGHVGRLYGRGGPRGPWHFHFPATVIFTYNVIMSVLLVGFNMAIKLSSRYIENEQSRKTLEKENLQSRLNNLQNQVSPHFFMNTLNNIHALIDFDKENAKEAILRLSKMMRYMLYDSDKGKTTLEKEIDFLSSYIELMRLRLHESVEIEFRYPEAIPPLIIPPHMFVSFVENAFKHGISYRKSSFIRIFIEVSGDRIHFNIKNSKPQISEENNEASGLGMENARKRLDILYDNNYTLNVFDREDEFEVDLVFPLSADEPEA